MLAAGAVVAMSACSQGGKSSDNASAESGSTTIAAPAPAPGPTAQAKTAIARPPKGQPLGATRQVVYTADLQVHVAAVGSASTRAISIVDGAGGFLFSQDANLEHAADETIVFKVPPAEFAAVLDRLGGLGSQLARHVAANDVTDQVVDLQGRLKTAIASTARLRALFTGAANVPDIVAIENDLETREAEVESLQGELRVVQNQVQLATITLALTASAPHHPAKHRTTTPGFTRALAAGWTAFTDATRVALAVIGATLPFVTFTGLVTAVVLAVRRRRRDARRPAGAGVA